MSITQTQTLPASTSSTRITQLQPFDYQERLDRLTEILFRYESWDDSLSLRCFNWGVQLLSSPEATSGRAPNSAALARALAHIDHLRQEILVNPLDRAPLVTPVLERGWTWEQWQLEDYLTLHPNSPFDGKPMTHAAPHLFALELLKWMQPLPAQRPAPSNEGALSVPSNDSSLIATSTDSHLNRSLLCSNLSDAERALKMFTYCQLARTAVTTQIIREKIVEPMQQASHDYAKLKKETNERILKESNLAKARAKTHERDLNNRLDQIDRTHSQTADALRGQVHNVEGQLRGTEASLRDTQSTLAHREQEIRHLQECNEQRAREIQQLRNALDDDDGCMIL